MPLDALQRVVPPADKRSEGFDHTRIDWSNTTAYSPDQNVIHLNAAGTQPDGIVPDGDAGELRREIAAGLREVAHPAIAEVARQPAAAIDVLAPAWVAPVYERMPEVSAVVASSFAHGELAWARRRAVAGTLAAARYAQCIVLPNSLKSAGARDFARA